MSLGIGGEVVARIKAVVEVDTSELKKGLSEASGEMKKTEGRMAGLNHAAGVVAAGGLTLLAGGIFESVKAAAEWQTEEVKLEKAVSNSGVSWRKYGKTIIDTITKMAEMSGFAKGDLSASYSKLITVTHSVTRSHQLLQMAMDLARATGKPLTATTLLVQKAYNGSATALSRMGIVLPKVTTAQDALKASGKKYTAEQMAAAKATDLRSQREENLAAIQKKFGGQSAAYAKTAAGQWARFQVTLKDMEEQVGMKVIPVLRSMLGIILHHTDAVKYLVGAIVAVTGAAVVWTAAVKAQLVVTKIAAAWSALFAEEQTAVNVAMDANPIGLVVVAIAALVAGVIYAYTHFKVFRETVLKVWHDIEPAVKVAVAVIKANIMAAWNIFSSVVNLIGDLVHGRWGNIWGDVKRLASAALTGIVTYLSGGFITDVGGAMHSVLGKITSVLSSAPKALWNAARQLGGWIVHALESGIGDIGGWVRSQIEDALNSINPFASGGKQTGQTTGAHGHPVSPHGSTASVVVNQTIVSGTDDQGVHMRRARFAAQAAFA